MLTGLVAEAEREKIFRPQAAYGYCQGRGRGQRHRPVRRGRHAARSPASPCRARPRRAACASPTSCATSTSPSATCSGLQVVTVGQRASEVAREWFAADRYQDYVRLHGLGVELAEALAEYVHGRIRAELGFGHHDARDMRELLKQGYRGSRYSFGYPACPNLADQAPLLELLGADRIGIELVRRGPALARAEHQRHRPAPPAGALLQRLRRQRRRAELLSWSGMQLSIFSAFIVELHEAQRPGAWQGFVNHGLTGLRMVEEVRPRPGLGRGGGRSGMSWGRRQGRRVVAMEAIWSSFGLRLMPGRRPD